MANGSGPAIAGIIIGIVVATQVSDFESADLDVPDADVESDEDFDSSSDDDADAGPDDDSTPQGVPTQVDAGVSGVELTRSATSVDISTVVAHITFGRDPAYISPVLDRPGVPATFCASPAQSSCCPASATYSAPWLRWTC